MRIAVLTNSYPPSLGGASTVAQLQVEALRGRGHDVRVFCVEPKFAGRGILSKLVMHLRDLGGNPSIVAEILAWQPESLISHNLTGCGMGTPRAVKRRGVFWLHIIHDVQLIEPSGQMIVGEWWPHLREVWRRGWSFLRRHALGAPDVAASPSQWSLDQHVRRGFFTTSRQVVLPNPMPVGSVDPATPRDKSIVFVGRVDADKGVSKLIAAWEMLGDERPRLDIVGEGSLAERLCDRHDPRLIVHGHVPLAETLKIMGQSLVLAVPSLLVENQPMVILQGLSVGCRAVATDVGGIAETLGAAGIIVPPNDVPKLAEALRTALSGPVCTEEQRQIVLARHEIGKVINQLEILLSRNTVTAPSPSVQT